MANNTCSQKTVNVKADEASDADFVPHAQAINGENIYDLTNLWLARVIPEDCRNCFNSIQFKT